MTTRTGPPPKSTCPRSSLTAAKRWPSACSALQPAEHGRLGRRVDLQGAVAALPAGARSRARARRSWARRRAPPAAPARRRAPRPASPVRPRSPAVSYEGARDHGPARGDHACGRPAADPRGRRDGQDADARRALRLARRAGDARGRDPRPDRRARPGRRAARAGRGAAGRLGALRGAVGDHAAGVLRAAAARGGARGGRRSVRHAGDGGRPAGAAARADRRAAARLARPARQPERACSARSSSGSTGSRTSW